jgi:hypothetical protein
MLCWYWIVDSKFLSWDSQWLKADQDFRIKQAQSLLKGKQNLPRVGGA